MVEKSDEKSSDSQWLIEFFMCEISCNTGKTQELVALCLRIGQCHVQNVKKPWISCHCRDKEIPDKHCPIENKQKKTKQTKNKWIQKIDAWTANGNAADICGICKSSDKYVCQQLFVYSHLHNLYIANGLMSQIP